MQTISENIVFGGVPDSILEVAGRYGFSGEECLFSMRSDLSLDGAPAEVWLVVGISRIATFSPDKDEPVIGPIMLIDIEKVRMNQTVGSAFLQIMLEGLYIDVIRYSNALREFFQRAFVQIERLLNDEALQEEALNQPSDHLCSVCGFILSNRGGLCPRCHARKGIFRRTLGLMQPYRGYVFILLSMMIVGVALDLVPPQLTRLLVDRVLVPRADEHLLPIILVGLLCTAGLRALLNVFIGRTSSYIGTRITQELRGKLVDKLLSLSVDYYDRHSVGGLMSRVLYDVDYFHGFVVQVAQGFLLNLMLVLGIGVILFTMNWRLALFVMLPVPFVIIGSIFFLRHIYPRFYRLWDSQSKMAQLLTGLFQGVRLVKAFGQERREETRAGKGAGYMRDARRSVEMSQQTFYPIMAFLFGTGGMIIWYFGGKEVLSPESDMSLGDLMAFIFYIGMFYNPIHAMSMFSNWLTGFLTAGQRVYEMLDASSSMEPPADTVKVSRINGHIEFKNVTFGYDPFKPVLKNVSLAIEPGQFIGVVGKSGSGKTTLVNLICRFYDPQAGQVLIDGIDVREMDPEDLHQQVALVLQEPFLFRSNIGDNIAYGRPDADPLKVIQAARAANAHDFIAMTTSGYDTMLGERGAGLSGGERQRVSIARALLCDPQILILDEATSSVDTESEQEIQKALARLSKGRTTIAVAHRLSTLKNADRIFVVDDGVIAEEGTHEELLELEGIYYKLVKIQTELTRLEM